MVGERCVDYLFILTVFSEKDRSFLKRKRDVAAELDEIRCACRGICRLDSIKVSSHSVKGSGRGDGEKFGF